MRATSCRHECSFRKVRPASRAAHRPRGRDEPTQARLANRTPHASAPARAAGEVGDPRTARRSTGAIAIAAAARRPPIRHRPDSNSRVTHRPATAAPTPARARASRSRLASRHMEQFASSAQALAGFACGQTQQGTHGVFAHRWRGLTSHCSGPPRRPLNSNVRRR